MFQILCVRITTTALVLGSSALLLGCSSSERSSPDRPAATAQSSPTADSSAPATTAQPPAAPGANSSGMRIFIDPKTGEPRAPTAAELAAMEQLEQKDSKLQAAPERRQTEMKLRGGGTAITLDEGVQTPLQACTNADGSIVVDHECQKTQQPKQDPKGGKP
jgi:hypothetical protein